MSAFLEAAQQAGFPVKLAYTVREVSKISGIPYSTLQAAVKNGDLKAFLPPGRTRGRLVRPEWFDTYWNVGMV